MGLLRQFSYLLMRSLTPRALEQPDPIYASRRGPGCSYNEPLACRYQRFSPRRTLKFRHPRRKDFANFFGRLASLACYDGEFRLLLLSLKSPESQTIVSRQPGQWDFILDSHASSALLRLLPSAVGNLLLVPFGRIIAVVVDVHTA